MTAALKPELLAPAGDWDSLRAAVANGADAVYFGLDNFNARHRAVNFTLDELPAVIDYLHQRNVRGYVAFNTLVFSTELPEAVRFLSAIAEAGTDAVIVQDLGVARLIHRLVPNLPVHGSTQMTLTEPRGIEFVHAIGVERVILARELSLVDIGRIAAATAVPLEVFVHGALCVAYSGQCLTSEALGGRSANRGQCAQACRLPYQLHVDGAVVDLGDKAYLLSPQDLAAYDLIDDLVRLGVRSFKIEGRLKSAHYVAATTQTYRAALNAASAEQAFALTGEQQCDLAQSFSRGLTPGFLAGVDHQKLVHGRFPKSRGVRVGTVVHTTKTGVLVEVDQTVPNAPLVKPGDGVVFDEGHPEQDEQGGRIYAVTPGIRGRIELVFGRGAVNLAALTPGCLVWKTDDPALRKRLERSYATDRPALRATLTVEVRALVGDPLRVRVMDEQRHEVAVNWPGPLEAARNSALSETALRSQFGRLGETPFELGAVHLDMPVPVMAPRSVLNDLRREAVSRLLTAREVDQRRTVAEPKALELFRDEATARLPVEVPETARLSVLVRSPAQLDAVLCWEPPASLPRPEMVWCEFEDVRGYTDAVSRARAANQRLGLASLRVQKPGEEGLLSQLARCEPDAILVRTLTALSFFREQTAPPLLVGDFSLNVANELTASLLLERCFARLTPSFDLNWDQLTALLNRVDPGWFEVVVHQHMPMFHMEHCVFAALLSDGADFRTCGRPCDRHQLDLGDRVGALNPVLADVGCRNTVFNAVAQTAAEYLPRMQTLGLKHFRVELLRERGPEVGTLLDRYARILAGQEDGRRTWRQLRVLNQLGVTRGTLQST